MASERVIGVMGATGYTGRLVAEELHRRGVACVLAGRDANKLAALSARSGGAETIVADVRRPATLRPLVERSKVLINCAGPFVDLGEPVVLAAIEGGAHYLDTTGEQPFIKAMREKHDEKARAARVAVVPAMAFEIALTDCGSVVVCDGFTDVESIEVTYAVAMHASQGTQRTAVRMLASEGWSYDHGEWIVEKPASVTKEIDFPPPVGRVAAVSFPSAEVLTIPMHERPRTVRAFMSVPRPAATALALLAPLLPGIGRLASRFAGSLIGAGTGGPDEKARAASAFHVAVDVRGIAEGRARWRRLLLRGADPYGLTAAIAVEAATRLMWPNFQRAGVLAPAQVVQSRPFLDAIAGVHYEITEQE